MGGAGRNRVGWGRVVGVVDEFHCRAGLGAQLRHCRGAPPRPFLTLGLALPGESFRQEL